MSIQNNLLIQLADEEAGKTFADIRRYLHVERVMESKSFECNGKHQYRHVDTLVEHEGDGGTITTQVWQCECGRKIND